MASCSTSLSSPSSHSSSLVLSKQRPFEFNRDDESFSEEANPLEDDYVFSDFKSLAAKDDKLRELIPLLEAVKRTKYFMKAFLIEKAEKIRRGEDTDSSDSEGEGEVEVIVPIPAFLPLFFQGKTEMVRLEFRSFIYKLWLRRIELIRHESREKYSRLKDFEQAIHNVQEIIKEYRNFIYKEYYNIEELQQICPLYLESIEIASSNVLKEKEKAGFEMTDEDVDRFDCPKVRLCALLGLKLDFLDRLEKVPPEHRLHRTLSDWIDIFLQNNIEAVIPAKKSSLTKDLLDSIGFDPFSAAVETIMARSFDGRANHHVEACEWANIFIRDEFKYNPLLSPLNFKFPFQGNLTNSWFQLPSATVEESESTADPCHVNIMNLATKELHASRDIQSTLKDFVLHNGENIVLYHGTDRESAVDILFRGIDLCAGREKRDFSCGSGFYLTKSLDGALDWAKSTTAKPAILIFQVNREFLDDAQKLNLNNNEEKWHQIVSSFRSGKRTAKTRKTLRSYDLIEGPMVTVKRSETTDELVLEMKPSSYQMCLISDDFADEFHKTLHSIVFLDIA